MPVKRGLPTKKKMRHDRHYVDELFGRDTGVMVEEISLEKIKPNPDQPRKDMGDLKGLANSIREQGVLEPILVNKGDQGQYIIISGERRFQASRLLETETIPCIVKNLEANQTLEVALVENLQRKDLHPFEEADGLRSLITTFQYTHEDIARKIGKSRSTVTEALAIAQLVGEVREASGEAGIHAKSMLLEIAKLKSVDEQLALIEKIASGAGREEVRRQNKKSQRAKPFVFKYQDPSKTFSFNLRFRKSEVERDELIGVLENILEDLRNQ